MLTSRKICFFYFFLSVVLCEFICVGLVVDILTLKLFCQKNNIYNIHVFVCVCVCVSIL